MAALELAMHNVELERLHEQLKALAITYAAFVFSVLVSYLVSDIYIYIYGSPRLPQMGVAQMAALDLAMHNVELEKVA